MYEKAESEFDTTKWASSSLNNTKTTAATDDNLKETGGGDDGKQQHLNRILVERDLSTGINYYQIVCNFDFDGIKRA